MILMLDILVVLIVHLIRIDAWEGVGVPGWIVEEFCESQEGSVALPWDCAGYVACSSTPSPSGVWVDCGHRMQFNQQSGICEPSSNRCSDISESLTQFCTQNPTVVFADPVHCARFYNCSVTSQQHGLLPYQQECRYTHLFDSGTRQCVRYDRLTSACGDRFEPLNPCDYKIGHCVDREFCIPCNARCEGLGDGLHPYPTYPDTRFHLHCAGGRTLGVLQCTGGRIFSPDRRTCVHSYEHGHGCDNPPLLLHSTSTVSYKNNNTSHASATATYKCDVGYGSCGGHVTGICLGDNVWDTAVECVQDTWTGMNNLFLTCPMAVNSSIQFRGRANRDLFAVSLMNVESGQTLFHVKVRISTRTVEAGTKLDNLKPVTSPVALTGKTIWRIEFREETFEMFVNTVPVTSTPHTASTATLNLVIIGREFTTDFIKVFFSETETILS